MTTYGWHIASVQAPPNVAGPDHRGWKVSYAGWNPCKAWCEQQFGTMTGPGPGSVWHYVGEGVFEFKNDSDRLMFLLRWS
jgi:hypothetical protein